jgi:hypothetical protein
MMKAAVVHEFGKPLTVEDVPVPEVPDGHLLVKVVASGVCHADLHAASSDWPVKPTLPFIPGQEGVRYLARRRMAALRRSVQRGEGREWVGPRRRGTRSPPAQG